MDAEDEGGGCLGEDEDAGRDQGKEGVKITFFPFPRTNLYGSTCVRAGRCWDPQADPSPLLRDVPTTQGACTVVHVAAGEDQGASVPVTITTCSLSESLYSCTHTL